MDCDVAVIGAGPAGVQAAIHASRKKASTIVLGKPAASALAGTLIDNYFGIAETSGDGMLSEGRSQAESTGAVFVEENVISAAREGDSFVLGLESGEQVRAKAVVIATGISRTKLNVPGERELFGKGVSYCAVCDCGFYRGRRAVIVGNDSEAAVSAELMTGFASETHWVCWDPKANDALVRRALDAGAVMHASRPASIEGDGKVEAIVLQDGTSIPTDGVFIELGAKSAADIALDLGAMPEVDDTIKVDSGCSAGVPGVYACGDVTGRPWQVAKAVGQGCVAGSAAADYTKGLK
ncbi:MAG: FAD-dependent oxidoreductase [Thermoplasmata archaeon]|nr:FAD-dependent oxidoreductase [Thermoplasmata archaeon]